MVKKLTLTIPDELYASLEDKRKAMNLSHFCAVALGKASSKIDILAFEAKLRFDVLSLDEALDRAFELGMKWAGGKATISELIYICGLVDKRWYNWENLITDKDVVECYEDEALYGDTYYINLHLSEDIEELDTKYNYDAGEDVDICSAFAQGACVILTMLEPLLDNILERQYEK